MTRNYLDALILSLGNIQHAFFYTAAFGMGMLAAISSGILRQIRVIGERRSKTLN